MLLDSGVIQQLGTVRQDLIGVLSWVVSFYDIHPPRLGEGAQVPQSDCLERKIEFQGHAPR